MQINAKRIRMAFRSPAHFQYAVRHVLRNSALGRIDRLSPGGYAFKPNLMLINLTGRCNLRCAMCMQPRGEIGDNDSPTISLGNPELEAGDWLEVIDQAAQARPAFYLTGGEPLMYKGVDRLIERIKGYKLPAAIVTNGTALAAYAERLVDLGLDNVTISIDGPEEVHDQVRRVPGAFRRTLKGIERLEQVKREKGSGYPTVKVNCVVLPENVAILEDTVEAVRRLGVSEMNFQHPIWDTAEKVERHNRAFASVMGDNGNGRLESKAEGEYFELEMSDEELAQLEAVLGRLQARADGEPRLSFFPPIAPRDWRAYYRDLNSAVFAQRCNAVWSMMRLLSDGSFEPCLHHVIGNVKQRPLWDLWNDERMRRFRRSLVEGGLYPSCARCCYRAY